MDEGLGRALTLVATGDPALYRIVARSLAVTLSAVGVAVLVALPLGYLLAHGRFAGRAALVTLARTLTAVPTVVVGLLLFGLLSRQGPLGGLGLLFTPAALVLGQALLALPIVTALTHSAVRSLDPRVADTARALGAGAAVAAITELREGRIAVAAAVVTAFGRVVGEVGCAMIVGGNIEGYTRTMSTAIALEGGRGEFAFGVGLGLVLLAVALAVNLGLQWLQERV